MPELHNSEVSDKAQAPSILAGCLTPNETPVAETS